MLFRFYFEIDSSESEKEAEELKRLKLGYSESEEFLICSKCKMRKPITEIDNDEKFWYCQNEHPNPIDKSKRASENRFYWDFKKVNEEVKNRLKTSYKMSDRGSHWVVTYESKKVPITIVDSPLTSSWHILLSQHGDKTLLVYLFEETKREISSVFSKNNFIFVRDFLKLNDEKLRILLDSIAADYNFSEIIKAEDEIDAISDYKELEEKVNKMLNLLKRNDAKLKELLSALQKHKEDVLGTRFVLIGGNYPTDIVPIELYSYVNRFLEVNNTTGYEVKNYEFRLPYSKFIEKVRTNPGKSMVFITSAKEIEGKVWRDIVEMKKNIGDWGHMIIDFDILSMLWAYTNPA